MPIPGIACFQNGELFRPQPLNQGLLLRGGHVVDPASGLDAEMDLLILGDTVAALESSIPQPSGVRVLDCRGLLVWPGLMDIHLHIRDLFEVSTGSEVCAAQDGVTLAISPGAGNTFMAPALLGAEVDRGFPIHLGLLLGAGPVLSCRLTNDQLVDLFRGRLSEETAIQGLSRNPITNQTAPFAVGIKEHMGHTLLGDENIQRLYDITSRAGLLFMSHTQDAGHTERLASLAQGRPLHLGHASAAGCGENGQESMARVLELCRQPNISGELVSTMLRRRGGCREGLVIHPAARRLCLEALEQGLVEIIVSDGQNHATMKGFGDTRDNIPAILELVQEGVLTLTQAVATMTCNPARLMAQRTGSPFWQKRLGHLGIGAAGNVTVVDPSSQSAVYTIVSGRIVSFEKRLVREGWGSGSWIFAHGLLPRMGVGDLPISLPGPMVSE